MKRHILSTLIIGLIASAIVMGLHVSGLLLRPELAIKNLLLRHATTTRSLLDQMHYLFVFILAAGVAWMTLATARRGRLALIVGILLLEVAGVAWVCSLYHVFFQPLPSVAGVALGFLFPVVLIGFE